MCSDVTTDPGRRRVFGEVQKRYQEPECQLRWVEECWNARSGYNTARSAFWRVIRGITHGLGIAASRAPNWPGSLAWANLYRIAPGVTGNPSAKLRRLQRDLCSARLARDLAELRPRRLLFLTGIDWAAPFIARCDSQIETRNGLVQGYGALHLADGWRVATVIAKHPQGKPESALTAEVLDSFAQVA